MDATEKDPFRYCAYCGVDCYVAWYDEGDPGGFSAYADDVEHKPDCPSVTGVYPVREQELGMRGPDDPYAHGMVCMDCLAPFALGDTFTHRQIEADVFEVVCLGCSALNPKEVA